MTDEQDYNHGNAGEAWYREAGKSEWAKMIAIGRLLEERDALREAVAEVPDLVKHTGAGRIVIAHFQEWATRVLSDKTLYRKD